MALTTGVLRRGLEAAAFKNLSKNSMFLAGRPPPPPPPPPLSRLGDTANVWWDNGTGKVWGRDSGKELGRAKDSEEEEEEGANGEVSVRTKVSVSGRARDREVGRVRGPRESGRVRDSVGTRDRVWGREVRRAGGGFRSTTRFCATRKLGSDLIWRVRLSEAGKPRGAYELPDVGLTMGGTKPAALRWW